ncbi:MAG TPA: hypothetical protein VFP12_04720 [Allosphingosinicella sp.]|nr:hypothetical protein [Allosphingosinicella sp.]
MLRFPGRMAARIGCASMLATLPAAAAALPPALPGPLEALQAYKDHEAEPCRKLIDLCEGHIEPTKVSGISGLDCRPAGPAKARCRFTVSGRLRCRARFVFEDGAAWYVDRAPRGREPRALQVRCRKIGGAVG